jgi:hypothetical protein
MERVGLDWVAHAYHVRICVLHLSGFLSPLFALFAFPSPLLRGTLYGSIQLRNPQTETTES